MNSKKKKKNTFYCCPQEKKNASTIKVQEIETRKERAS
jgi:hypothetical protein